ncbi:cytochrome c biogenesis protein [Criblamydia sequanensis]|uniref:Cytochrome c biogenesis protein CcsA n=1 Tax=Candidatus Criblamydia sequanensis CRIB-18 TaxID=1437425 RepID=A0A090D1T8_9BACT|nr:cytochrome c biogenesis protein CcsA [Criblamydia sequanensis]CDR34080.1 Cytochrome c biogenesis protein CcsA [Criblamydia sequanensis CRIB-18]
MKKFLLFASLFLALLSQGLLLSSLEELGGLAVSYKGRFRPLESASKLWLEDLYGKDALDENLLLEYPWLRNPIALKLYMEAYGPSSMSQEKLLFLEENLKDYFDSSYVSLSEFETALGDKIASVWLSPLILEAFLKVEDTKKIRDGEKIELSSLSQGLVVKKVGSHLKIQKTPPKKPWSELKTDETLAISPPIAKELLYSKKLLSRYLYLSSVALEKSFASLVKDLSKEHSLEASTHKAEELYPLAKRMAGSQDSFLIIPSKLKAGVFFPLASLNSKRWDSSTKRLSPVTNYTNLEDADFEKLKRTYLEFESALKNEGPKKETIETLKNLLSKSYGNLAAKTYLSSNGKTLAFPSLLQLKLERFYTTFRLLNLSLIFFFLSCLFLIARKISARKSLFLLGLGSFGLGLLSLSLLLSLRIIILERPPVSNMDETLLFVPFVIAVTAFFLAHFMKSEALLLMASLATFFLLGLASYKGMDRSLDPLQPVLNSNYWLTIHVLLVVSSYSLFILSGIAAHCFVLFTGLKKPDKLKGIFYSAMKNSILAGTVLLIAGTLLGGVWAAESWGRFWDWDPKESWAFISICLYLVIIHLIYFREVKKITLSYMAIGAMQAIIFTWYGVNYILGSGLHSYGFGTGGEAFFFLGLILETLFIGITYYWLKKTSKCLN